MELIKHGSLVLQFGLVLNTYSIHRSLVEPPSALHPSPRYPRLSSCDFKFPHTKWMKMHDIAPRASLDIGHLRRQL
jgi:hypothetical protein